MPISVLRVIIVSIILVSFSCSEKVEIKENEFLPAKEEELNSFLPENLIAVDSATNTTARYILPTERYAHGILGDRIEGGGLLVTVKDKNYALKLSDEFVFEDLQPRLIDFNNDGMMEIVTIRTSVSLGGGIAVYEIKNDELQLLASNDFIGIPSRWLNIAAIEDLDGDGVKEIAWVQTPHIGGILKIGAIQNNEKINVLAEVNGVTNHRIGSRNLCLTVTDKDKTLFIPNNSYDKIVGLKFKNGEIQKFSEVSFNVDPSKSLFTQFNFGLLPPQKWCINGEVL